MLHELHPNIEVLNEYVSATSDLQCRCLRCGYTWHSDAHKLLRGKGCLRCSSSWIPTNEEFCQRLANHNPNVQTLEPYLGADKKIKVRCLLCGNEWHAKPFDLSRGHGCPACGGNQKKNHGQFVAELARINPNIEILDEYTNSRGKIRCRCLVCGSEWEPIPNNLLRGASCPICSKGKTAARFTEEMRAVNPTIQLHDPYVRSKEKIKCKCLICGHTWAATPNNLLRGSGCPNCARSKTVRNLVSYSPRD